MTRPMGDGERFWNRSPSTWAEPPHLSLNQLAKRDGRCRKQMAKLLNLSWLCRRIVEAIGDGTPPQSINRTRLLATELPLDWAEQEALFGLAA
jgi:site-specific DNA recombinase